MPTPIFSFLYFFLSFLSRLFLLLAEFNALWLKKRLSAQGIAFHMFELVQTTIIVSPIVVGCQKYFCCFIGVIAGLTTV